MKAFSVAAGVAIAAFAATVLPADADGKSVLASGPLQVNTTVANNPMQGVTATVSELVTPSGRTSVMLELEGIAEQHRGRTFGAHAHTDACFSTAGHYTHPTAGGSLEDREIWLDVKVNGDGKAVAVANRAWTFVPTSGANSVVIHANPTNPAGGAGTRLGCITVPFVGAS